MKSLKYGMLTLTLVSAALAPFASVNAQNFDYRQNLPYRGDYRQEIRGPVYFSRGDRLPERYQSGQFIVRDWWGNNLDRPSRNMQWVRVNNQFILYNTRNNDIKKVIRIEDRRDHDWGGADRRRPDRDFPDRGRGAGVEHRR